MDKTVPESATFYVRGALNRALSITKQDAEEIRKHLAEHPELPHTIKMSLMGAVEYHEQWLKEATAEFRNLPDGLRPNLDD